MSPSLVTRGESSVCGDERSNGFLGSLGLRRIRLSVKFETCFFTFLHNNRVQILKEGRKRKLIFKDVKVSDQGMISCTSNADETKGELVVECKYTYIVG
jgi:hypothetical protein